MNWSITGYIYCFRTEWLFCQLLVRQVSFVNNSTIGLSVAASIYKMILSSIKAERSCA
jgi:hypothetical protein